MILYIIFFYWILTTLYGMYWLIKNPFNKKVEDEKYFTLFELLSKIFPSALLSWFIIPIMILSNIKFKR